MRVNINQIKEMKARGEKIAILTAYDYSTAQIVDEAGTPLFRSMQTKRHLQTGLPEVTQTSLVKVGTGTVYPDGFQRV